MSRLFGNEFSHIDHNYYTYIIIIIIIALLGASSRKAQFSDVTLTRVNFHAELQQQREKFEHIV